MESVNSFGLRTRFLAATILLLLVSCQPKDIDLQSAQQAAKQKQVSDQQLTSKGMDISELNKLVAVTIERAFEPLQLMRAKLDSDFANQQDLKIQISSKPEDSDELPEELMDSKIASKDKMNRLTNTESTVGYKIDEFSVDAGGKLRKLVLVKNVFKKTTQRAYKDLNNKKSDNFDSQSLSEKMTIRPSADENIYVIKVSRSDNTNSKKDKNSLIHTETKIKIIWDGQKDSLNQALQVVHIEVETERQLSKTGNIKIYDQQPTDLTVQIGTCVSISGKVKMNTVLDKDLKMTNPEEVVITDSSFLFSTKQVSKALPCESRPVVDLARML